MRIDRVKEVIRVIMEEGEVPMLVGEAGIGKTEVIKELSHETSRQLHIVVLSQMEPGDLLGLPFIDGGATRYSPPDWLPKTGKSIIFFDEINRAHRLLRAAVMELLIDKRIHSHVLPEETWVVGAVNPSNENYEVYEIIDLAFIDRFVWIPVTNSLDSWSEYMKNKFFDERIKEISEKISQNTDLTEFTEYFHKNPDLPEIKLTPRSLTRYVKLFRAFEKRGMLDEFFEISYGIVGKASNVLNNVLTSDFDVGFTYLDLLEGNVNLSKRVDSIQRISALKRLLFEIERELEENTFEFEKYEKAFEVIYKTYSLEETNIILRWIFEMKQNKKKLYKKFERKKKEYYIDLYYQKNPDENIINQSTLKRTLEENSWFYKVIKKSLTAETEDQVNKDVINIAI